MMLHATNINKNIVSNLVVFKLVHNIHNTICTQICKNCIIAF